MRTVAISNRGFHREQLKTIARDMGANLTDGPKRPWHLEIAISAVIFFLGAAILLTTAR